MLLRQKNLTCKCFKCYSRCTSVKSLACLFLILISVIFIILFGVYIYKNCDYWLPQIRTVYLLPNFFVPGLKYISKRCTNQFMILFCSYKILHWIFLSGKQKYCKFCKHKKFYTHESCGNFDFILCFLGKGFKTVRTIQIEICHRSNFWISHSIIERIIEQFYGAFFFSLFSFVFRAPLAVTF